MFCKNNKSQIYLFKSGNFTELLSSVSFTDFSNNDMMPTSVESLCTSLSPFFDSTILHDASSNLSVKSYCEVYCCKHEYR